MLKWTIPSRPIYSAAKNRFSGLQLNVRVRKQNWESISRFLFADFIKISCDLRQLDRQFVAGLHVLKELQ